MRSRFNYLDWFWYCVESIIFLFFRWEVLIYSILHEKVAAERSETQYRDIVFFPWLWAKHVCRRVRKEIEFLRGIAFVAASVQDNPLFIFVSRPSLLPAAGCHHSGLLVLQFVPGARSSCCSFSWHGHTCISFSLFDFLYNDLFLPFHFLGSVLGSGILMLQAWILIWF